MFFHFVPPLNTQFALISFSVPSPQLSDSLFLHFWYFLPPRYPYTLGDLNGYLPHSPNLLQRGPPSACVVKMPMDLARSVYSDECANHEE